MEAALGLIRLRDLEVDYGDVLTGKVTWKNLALPKGSPVTLLFLLGKDGVAHAFSAGEEWLIGSMVNTVASELTKEITTGIPSKAMFPGEWDAEVIIGTTSRLLRSIVADNRIFGIHAGDLASYFLPYDRKQIQAALVVNGSNLKGTVKAKSTKEALNGVSVTTGLRGTQTDQSGYYRIDYLIPGLHTVRFQRAGYNTVDAPVNLTMGENTLNMELEWERIPYPPPGPGTLNCPLCGTAFPTSYAVIKHLATVHREELPPLEEFGGRILDVYQVPDPIAPGGTVMVVIKCQNTGQWPIYFRGYVQLPKIGISGSMHNGILTLPGAIANLTYTDIVFPSVRPGEYVGPVQLQEYTYSGDYRLLEQRDFVLRVAYW